MLLVVGVSFDGEDHCGICIYSNQSMNTVHGADKDKAMGGLRPRCGLRRTRRHPNSSLGGSRESGVGTERPPERSGVRGATCSPWRICILFVSIFPQQFLPPPLQPQMSNMAEGLAFVSKMMIMEVFFSSQTETFLLTAQRMPINVRR